MYCQLSLGVDDIDYALYPNETYQKAWLRVYLEEFLAPNPVTEEAIHRLYVQVNKFALSSHFLWAVWALIQFEHSKIDFDFLKYVNLTFYKFLFILIYSIIILGLEKLIFMSTEQKGSNSLL